MERQLPSVGGSFRGTGVQGFDLGFRASLGFRMSWTWISVGLDFGITDTSEFLHHSVTLCLSWYKAVLL